MLCIWSLLFILHIHDGLKTKVMFVFVLVVWLWIDVIVCGWGCNIVVDVGMDDVSVRLIRISFDNIL